MRKKKYVVNLSRKERSQLLHLTKKGRESARVIARAHILLLAHEGALDGDTARALHVGESTVARTRRRFAEGGLQAALYERPRPGAQRKLDDKQEARLVALTCSNPPDGRAKWTLRLLAGSLVEQGVVDTVCHETVRQTLKKGGSSPGS